MNKFSFTLFLLILLSVLFLCHEGKKLQVANNYKQTHHNLDLLVRKVENNHYKILEKKSTNFIKKVEGFSDRCYKDAKGTYAIGYGTQVSKEMCDNLGIIDESVAVFLMEEHTKKIFKILRELEIKDENKHKSLSSFAYNIGYDNFKKSKVYLEVKRGNWEAAKKEMLEWGFKDKKYESGGLKRRMNEVNLL
jgi:GH24 family phage-related lysozyme (muramidase)